MHLRLANNFMIRMLAATLLVTSAELAQWQWLRLATSEAVIHALVSLGVAASRISFDTIMIRQELFQFVVPCTFVDVIAGSFPFLWKVRKSLLQNFLYLATAAATLLIVNLIRLVVAQMLYAQGIRWVVADSVMGGIFYFAVWIAIWRQRDWQPIAPRINSGQNEKRV